jgi:hypothetical protein
MELLPEKRNAVLNGQPSLHDRRSFASAVARVSPAAPRKQRAYADAIGCNR